jgi:hypothetical protein
MTTAAEDTNRTIKDIGVAHTSEACVGDFLRKSNAASPENVPDTSFACMGHPDISYRVFLGCGVFQSSCL